MSSIVVHHLNASRSQRVLWLLEELDLEYDLKTYERNPRTLRAPDTLKQAHPLGKSPVVEIDGRTYAETGNIIEAVLDRFDDDRVLRPARETEAYETYRFFLHYAEGSLMPPLLVALLTHRVRTAPLPFFLKPIATRIADRIDDSFTNGELALHRSFVEQHLVAHDHFAGDAFTAADITMAYGIDNGATRGMFGPEQARTLAWLDRMKARPAYQRAETRGGSSTLRI